jgi:hypothetical protein
MQTGCEIILEILAHASQENKTDLAWHLSEDARLPSAKQVGM